MWHTTALMSGGILACLPWMTLANLLRWLVSHQTILAPQGSAGETQCTAGTSWLIPAMRGGLHDYGPSWNSWILCVWTIFVVSKATTSSQPKRLRPYEEPGAQAL